MAHTEPSDAGRALGVGLGTVGAEIVRAWIASIGTDLTADEAIAAAMASEETDYEIPLDILGGIKDGGTWAAAMSSAGAPSVTRTAGAATEGWWVNIEAAMRNAASRGLKVIGVRTVYTVNTADATDVRTELYSRTQPAHGAAMAAATLLAGDADADYDSNHNTAVKRGSDTAAPALHTATMQIPSGEQAFATTGKEYSVKFVVVDPGTSAVALVSMHLLCARRDLDVA